MKSYLFVSFLLALSLVYRSNGFCFKVDWQIHILNGLAKKLLIHPTSNDGKDLGSHLLNYGDDFVWQFCENYGNVYYSTFFMDYLANRTVYNYEIERNCNQGIRTGSCYWLVRLDGFYLNGKNTPFPGGGWVKYYNW
ncbi:putative plant self-incompatibility S1 [Helianthus anomalus]